MKSIRGLGCICGRRTGINLEMKVDWLTISYRGGSIFSVLFCCREQGVKVD